MTIKLVGQIADVQTIAVGRRIREHGRLRRMYGIGRWRKQKGVARVQLPNGLVRWAEVHWYEAHGIGRRELKVKRLIGERE